MSEPSPTSTRPSDALGGTAVVPGAAPGPGAGAGPDLDANSMAAPIVDEDIPDPEQVDSRCPHCGAPVSSAESFCEACGTDLVSSALNSLDQPSGTTPDSPQPLARQPIPQQPVPQQPVPQQPVPQQPILQPGIPGDALDLGPGESAEMTHRRPQPPDPSHSTEPAFGPVSRECAECGGRVGDDLYCEQCGTKAPSERDHFTEQPAPWVAGVCDRGIRHHRNEDAMALWAQDGADSNRAVLVVCDGVSTSTDSDLASLAAARAARQVLVNARPAGLGVESSRTAALAQIMTVAAAEANAAVVRSSAGRPGANAENPASCTFAVAVVDGRQIGYANIGDSRVYWLPDGGDPAALSVDDSVAQVRISMGVPRDQAENSPQAHAITRWLGPDAPDLNPTTGSMVADGPGWVMVCSDGLWNYASAATQLAALVDRAIADDPGNAQPLQLAGTLTQWANDQGGKDNITVALARLGPLATGPTRSTGPASPDPDQEGNDG